MKRFYPYVKTKYNTKIGEIPIYIRYDYNRVKRTLIPIGHSIASEHWDYKRKWVKKSCPNYEKIDQVLIELTGRLGNILAYANQNLIDPNIDFVLLELAKNKEYDLKSKRVDLFNQLDKYIVEQKNLVTDGVITDYKSLKKHLNGFKDHSSQAISFSNLNLTFYNEFVEYLSYIVIKRDGTVGLFTNTVGKQIKNLKAFVRNRIEKKIIPNIDLKAFKTIEEEVDYIYLTEAEIKRIFDLDLSRDKMLEEIRDLFVFGCYTGLRYSNLSSLTPANFDDELEVIQVRQSKVHKAVTIPYIDYVPGILKKYKNELPEIHLDDFNREIKNIGALAGLFQLHMIVRKKGKDQVKEEFKKHELISSHTCRRSFCTNMYLAGFPAVELMKISGHKSVSAFLTYVKQDNLQAAMRLKELRKNLNKLSA